MKKIAFAISFLIITGLQLAKSQGVAINNTGNTPNSHAMLDVDDSDNKTGILIPRLTTSQRTSISLSTSDKGLTVFDETTNSYWYWDGTQWVEIGIDGKYWKLTGNAGTTSSNFIGTTDNVDLHFRINNTASGFLSQNNTAFGYQSGYSITSNAINNVFFGDNAGYNDTEGDENVFIGHRVGYYMQKGNSNTAIGYNAFYNYGGAGGGPRDGGNKNVAIGKWAMFNPYQGDGNVAVGFDAFSLPNSGEYNVFIGYNSDRDNNNNLNNAIAIGANSVADADNATAIGYRAYASQANSLILGQTTNDGNQNSATANTNVGINTITPETGANLTLGAMDGNNEGGQITWYGAGSYPTWRTDINQNQFRIFAYSSNNTAVSIFNYGSGNNELILHSGNNSRFLELDRGNTNTFNVSFGDNLGGISNPDGIVYFEVNGDETYIFGGHVMSDADGSRKLGDAGHRWREVWAANGTIQTSDMNQKEDVNTLNYGLNEIMSLHPITFRWKNIENYNDFKIGLSAQELQQIIPEVVVKDKIQPNAPLGVMYSDLIPILVKAIQEQQQEINELKKE